MISKRTVLVLGTGASVPYGFPTGRTLLLDAATEFGSGDPQFLELLGKININPGLAGEFSHLLRQSMQPSIDAFVEQRPEYLNVGKAAIAIGLIPHELPKILEMRKAQLQWYEYLFHQLGPSVGDIQNSQLSIVTFNYDRSLEYFLFQAFTRAFPLDRVGTLELLSSIPIIHVHGILAEPKFQSNYGRDYSPSLDLKAVRAAIGGIVIPGAETVDDQAFDQARGLISQAESICFLGFGFHSANLARLELSASPDRFIYASAFRLPRNIVQRTRRTIPGNTVFGRFDEDGLVFLQNNSVFE